MIISPKFNVYHLQVNFYFFDLGIQTVFNNDFYIIGFRRERFSIMMIGLQTTVF
jgi:hypothetical protein